MKYVITKESLEAAKKIDRGSTISHVRWHELYELLDTLYVPEDEQCEVKPDERIKGQIIANGPGNYSISWNPPLTDPRGTKITITAPPQQPKPIGPEQPQPDGCIRGTGDMVHWDKLQVLLNQGACETIEKMLKKYEPKPFGPGTRLRAKNGDELMVIGHTRYYGVVNLTTKMFASYYFLNLDRLIATLERDGAEVIDEM